MWNEEKPILNVEIYEGAHLEILEPSVVPIIMISSEDNEVRSKVGTKNEENFIWNEKLTLPLEPRADVIFKLCTVAEHVKVIKRALIPFEMLAENTGPINMWIDLSKNDDASVSFSVTGVLATGLLRCARSTPQVKVTFIFDHNNYLKILSAEVNAHKIILKNREFFTLYYTSITRNDSKNWVKAFRYSDIYNMKSELEKVEHGLRNIDLPGKTYFEFLSCVWPSLGRFHPSTIEKRKKGIQEVLNYMIEKQRNLDVITLLNS